ncbi:MAG TPA: nuclear transport factor 2 family protein [Solirubrobacterales bacterium]|nr:nuclear transport factor 2 family protein [Solirubrobacterales bacterium]
MSEQNVEIVRRMIDAYNRRDRTAWFAFMDPEIETWPVETWPESGPFKGVDVSWDFYAQSDEAWKESGAYEIVEQIDAGDAVFVCVRRDVRGKESAAEIEFRLYQVASFRNGKLIRSRWFLDRDRALEAAGLSE